MKIGDIYQSNTSKNLCVYESHGVDEEAGSGTVTVFFLTGLFRKKRRTYFYDDFKEGFVKIWPETSERYRLADED